MIGSASYQRRLLKGKKMFEADGWNYTGKPVEGFDARKIVTLTEGGMVWVGIRAWHGTGGYWMNGGEPERATVKAWRNLPEPAAGFWDRGNLHVPKTPNV